MDTKTWNSLSEAEKKEIQLIGTEFKRCVFESNAGNGWDFYEKYEVREINNWFFIYEKNTDKQLGELKFKNRKIIDALFTDTVQNYGR